MATTRRRGARSILGSLSTYARAAVLLVVLLGLAAAAWWSQQSASGAGPTVGLGADAPWAEVSLDDGQRLFVLTPGARTEVRPGTYRATFVPAAGGGPVRAELVIDGPVEDLAALAP